MEKKKESLLKKWSIWYEPYVEEYYIVIKVYGKKVTIKWLLDGTEYTGYKHDCFDDEYVRMATPLEKELI